MNQSKQKMIGNIFEIYVGSLYEKKGWSVIYVGQKLGVHDGGIDLIAIRDRDISFIQCKYHSTPLEVSIITDFRLAYDKYIDIIQEYLNTCGTYLSEIYNTPSRKLYCKNEQNNSVIYAALRNRIDIVVTGSIPYDFSYPEDDYRFSPIFTCKSDNDAQKYICYEIWNHVAIEVRIKILIKSSLSLFRKDTHLLLQSQKVLSELVQAESTSINVFNNKINTDLLNNVSSELKRTTTRINDRFDTFEIIILAELQKIQEDMKLINQKLEEQNASCMKKQKFHIDDRAIVIVVLLIFILGVIFYSYFFAPRLY